MNHKKRNSGPRLNRLNFHALESRRVLANFLPVQTELDAGVLTITASPNSNVTVVEVFEDESNQLFFREAIEAVEPDLGLRFSEAKEFVGVESIVYRGNHFVDNVQIKASIPSAAYGNNGNDSLRAKMVVGGLGDDQLFGDIVFGNDGNDTIKDTYDNATNFLSGGSGDDTIYGSFVYGDIIHGDDGDDTIFADLKVVDQPFGSNDVVYGGAGDDYIFGGGSNDRLFGGLGNDQIDAGSGDDEVFGGAGIDSVFAGAGSDWVNGGDGDDKIDGGVGNDSLLGGGGNDWLIGNRGNDWIKGEDGDDLIEVGRSSRRRW